MKPFGIGQVLLAVLWTLVVFGLGYYYNARPVQRLIKERDVNSLLEASPLPNKKAQPTDEQLKRANAVMLILTRNSELDELKEMLISFEYLFNSQYNYPYVFLNDEPFTVEFIKEVTEFVMVRYSNSKLLSKRNVSFGLIPKEHWSYPAWIDQEKAAQRRREMEMVPYYSYESYHHMCRYYSGFFYRHPLLETFDFYWRIEPHVKFFCKLDYDPFVFMMQNNIEYGFLPIQGETLETVPTLWKTALKFLKDVYPTLDITRPRSPVMNALLEDPANLDDRSRSNYFNRLLSHLEKTNSSDDLESSGIKWNLCHFYNNFEIGSFKFFRSSFYQSYFDFVDKAGGFYYERWGDSPIHSLAVGMFLDFSQIHNFDEIGYEHNDLWCPIGDKFSADKCFCNQEKSILGFKQGKRSCSKQYQSALQSYYRN